MCPNFEEKILMCQDKFELGYLGMRLVSAELCLLSNTYLYQLNFHFKNASNGGGTYVLGACWVWISGGQAVLVTDKVLVIS